ncbi:MAG TPA: hypothetical protein VGB91_00080 [Rhizomicrobium sp.]
MTGLFRRAFCAVAGALAFAGAGHAAAPATMAFAPLGSVSRAAEFGGDFVDARLSVADTTPSVSLITGLDLELGYKVDLAGRIAPVDLSSSHAFDGLFLSSASAGSPYAALAGGGQYLGVSLGLGDGLKFSVATADIARGESGSAADAYTALARLGGQPAPYATRTADALLAGISWQPTDWASFGVLGSQTGERDGILGNAVPGANAATTALGVSARVRFGNGWSTTASYGEAITQVDLKSGLNPLAFSGDGLHTRAYGIAVAKNGLFGDDSLGVAVSRPALGADGAFVTMPGATVTPSLIARSALLQGIGPSRETDVEIGYVTTFLDGSLALQTNAAFQMNYAGRDGNNAVSLLSRARIKF